MEERPRIVFQRKDGVQVVVDRLKRIPVFEDTPQGELIVGDKRYLLNFEEIIAAENEGNREYFEQDEGLRAFKQLMDEEDISFEEINERLGDIKFEFVDITDREFN